MKSDLKKNWKGEILRIVILNYLLHPILVVLIFVAITLFGDEEVLILATSWPIYAYVVPFLIGIPTLIKTELGKVVQLKSTNDGVGLKRSYRMLHLVFIGTTSLYGLGAAPICYLLGFDTKIVSYVTFIGFFYPILAAPLAFTLFNQAMDRFF
ncbi:MAG: hypothetical protein AAF551_14265, partial [Bacteroidota bacterium]